jgi:hypothetical protein
MDVRHITETPPPIYDGSGLRKMFDMQKTLVDGYVKIENLPAYPINLSIRKDQYLVKDFVGRVVEELAEAYESYFNMLQLYEVQDQSHDEKDYLPSLQNFNEELADALHFQLELFMYCNLTEADITDYLHKLLVRLNLQDVFWYNGTDPLLSFFSLAKHLNAHDALYTADYTLSFKVIPDSVLKDKFLKGGRGIGRPNAEAMSKLNWEVTFHLHIARNFLKNKPWKQSEMMTDEKRFYNSLMESWVALFRLFDFVGLDTESLFHIYFCKNKVNVFRQNSNY